MRLIDADRLRESFLDKDGEYEFFMTSPELFIKDYVDYQPTVNSWVPCKERMPEKDGNYFVTKLTGSVSIVRYFANEKKFISGIFWDAYDVTDFVTAWMEAPEPYKGDKSES